MLLILLIQRLIVRRAFAGLRPIYRDIEQLERGRIVTLSEEVPRERGGHRRHRRTRGAAR